MHAYEKAAASLPSLVLEAHGRSRKMKSCYYGQRCMEFFLQKEGWQLPGYEPAFLADGYFLRLHEVS